MTDFELKVGGMACDGCASAVKSATTRVAPEARVEVDLASKRVSVSGAPSRDIVIEAIRKAGYEILG